MRIHVLFVLITVLLVGSCSKREADYVAPKSATFNAFQKTIDSTAGIHKEIFSEVAKSQLIADPALLGSKSISGRRLFKTMNGHVAGLYDLSIKGKVSSIYKVLIADESILGKKLFFLKKTDSLEYIGRGKQETVFDLLDRQGNKVGHFRFSELFKGKGTHAHLKTESSHAEKDLTNNFSMFFLEPSEPDFALCGLCGGMLFPEDDGVYYYCECPYCGVELIYPPSLTGNCFTWGGVEVGDPGGSGGSGGGGTGTHPPVPSVTVALIKQYLYLADYQITYLNQNQSAAQDILQGLIDNNGSPEAIKASRITLEILQVNNITGPYDMLHLTRLLPYNPQLRYSELATHNPLFWAYFKVNCAIIKLEHPEYSNIRVYWEATKEYIHSGLDIIGLIPVVGEVADLFNGFIYTVEGDGVNASLSFASMVPVAGWGATAAKYAKKSINALDGTTRTLRWVKQTNGIINFGERGLLRKVLGLSSGDARVAHHLIPWEKGNHPLIQKMAQGQDAFHLNERYNGLALSSIQHSGSHNAYSAQIQQALDIIQSRNLSDDMAFRQLKDFIDHVSSMITSHPNTPINNLILTMP
jgi:hypothetical protein